MTTLASYSDENLNVANSVGYRFDYRMQPRTKPFRILVEAEKRSDLDGKSVIIDMHGFEESFNFTTMDFTSQIKIRKGSKIVVKRIKANVIDILKGIICMGNKLEYKLDGEILLSSVCVDLNTVTFI